MNTVVLASRNAKKLTEMQALLAVLKWDLRLVSDFTDEAAAETAPTFVENAILKARHAAQASGLPAIADDSGLEVDALGGRPGVRSARYAGVEGDDAANNTKLLLDLRDIADEQRGTQFVCVLAFLRHAEDPTPRIAQAAWRGRILHAPRGAHGFGYDPLFFVPGEGCASAELAPAHKNRISHRAQAAARLVTMLKGAPR